MGFHFLLQGMKVKSESEVAQSCLTLSDPMDCSPPGSSIHGIFQARVLSCLKNGRFLLELFSLLKFSLYSSFWFFVFFFCSFMSIFLIFIYLELFIGLRRQWQPTPVLLPGKSQGWRSLVGCRLWGGTESDMTEATWQRQCVSVNPQFLIYLCIT